MTFSVVARCGDLLGIAIASASFAVGASVPAIAPGLGAVVSQAYTNSALRHRVLSALRAGEDPETALAGLPLVDAGMARRQLAVIDIQGRTAMHTGAECSAWAGGLIRAELCVVGNLLPGPQVLQAVAATLDEVVEPGIGAHAFAAALIDALDSGQQAGGEIRGQRSAAVLVAGSARGDLQPALMDLDVRIDSSEKPVAGLRSLLDDWVPRPQLTDAGSASADGIA